MIQGTGGKESWPCNTQIKKISDIGWIGKAIEIKEFFHKMCAEKKELF